MKKAPSPSLFIIGLMTATLFSLTNMAADAVKSDNAKMNEKIELNHEVTSQDQGSSEADIKTTQSIRQEVTSQESFSTNAKNIKIVTMNGSVILKGPVKTRAEKNKIELIAKSVAGKTKVTSEITVTK
jgi:hyperosmotically inducible periplasmic protein